MSKPQVHTSSCGSSSACVAGSGSRPIAQTGPGRGAGSWPGMGRPPRWCMGCVMRQRSGSGGAMPGWSRSQSAGLCQRPPTARSGVDEHQVQRLLQAALGCTPEASRVWACARQLGLDATLWRHQEALGLKFRSLVGPPAQWRAHLADTIARRHDLGVLLQGYTRPVVLLKGEGMASDLYGDPYARRSGDIDLLVPWSEVQSLAAHLEARGYLPRTLTPPPRSLYNQWEWEHPETCRVVEIHWALANPQVPMPPAQEVIARAIWTNLGGSVRRVDPLARAPFFPCVRPPPPPFRVLEGTCGCGSVAPKVRPDLGGSLLGERACSWVRGGVQLAA